MAQIVFPTDFSSQRELLADIIKKNSALGADSPLAAWLIEKNIDLAVDTEAGNAAQSWEDQKISFENSSVAANQQRDLQFAAVYSFLLAAAQALKTWYKPAFATLLDWGIPITATGRIDYPASFIERSEIADKIFTKLATFDAGKSPLQAYIAANKIDIPVLTALLSDATKNSTTAIENSKLSENATEQRNLLWKDPLAHIRLIADFLKSIYRTSPRTLGEWGFTVDDSNKKTALRKTKLGLGETKLLTGIRIGSIITVTGKGAIVLYKGKDTTGEKFTLQSGGKMGMIKGFSIVTISNPSTLETTEISIGNPE